MTKLNINSKGPISLEFRMVKTGSWFLRGNEMYIKTTPAVAIDLKSGLGVSFLQEDRVAMLEEVQIIF